jgi:hypothetical protein
MFWRSPMQEWAQAVVRAPIFPQSPKSVSTQDAQHVATPQVIAGHLNDPVTPSRDRRSTKPPELLSALRAYRAGKAPVPDGGH